MKDWVVSLADAKKAPLEPGRRSSLLMQHGTMTLRYYAPRGTDPQTPHSQDEIYVVAAGSATVLSGPREDQLERKTFGPGDAIFVPAGHVHRFVDFSDDFGAWVVFWGPEGGDATAFTHVGPR
jgi:mannose-6-phosphate isomerase-like protein (cupin superfamily)